MPLYFWFNNYVHPSFIWAIELHTLAWVEPLVPFVTFRHDEKLVENIFGVRILRRSGGTCSLRAVDPPLCYTIQTSRRFRVSILSNPIWATTNFHVEIRCTVRSRSQKGLVSRSEFCLVTTSAPGAWRWRCVGAALRRTRSKGQSGVNVASNATRLVNSSGDFLTASFQPKPAPAPAAVGTTRPFQTQALGGVRESNCFLRSTDETTTAVRPVFESKTIIE